MTALNKVREGLVGNIAAMDQYRIRTGQVMTAQDALTKKIIEGKAHWGDLIKNYKMAGSILKDQIALQRAYGVGWTQSAKTGKFSTDLIIPQDLPSRLRTARAEIGLLSQAVASASDNTVKWGKNTQWAGRQLMVGFTVPMTIAAAAAGKFAYDLDKQITQVVKVYGDAASGFQETSDSIRDSALTTAKAAARIYGQSAEDTLGVMAQLAASGKSGIELQQATMATTRAAILGELDWQDAVKATISMQEVYQASQQELADNWNYINAMENQTVLSAQDFVTAIPRVSGVMNELGGDLKDTGALLTAFKAAGIDAAEGANALKSINFRLVATYGKGLETFKAKTGQDLRALIDETNGETIPSLTKFAEAIKDLSAPDKVAVTRDVFGIYQGSKALMLLEQMTKQTEQWTQALQVANNTNIQNAAIAQQELDRQSERPFRKLDIAVQSLKIQLGEVGQAFLEPAAFLVNAVSNILKAFNDLNPTLKTMLAIGALITGLAGPVVMLIGLFANLAGNTMKLFANIGMLTTGFKAMTVEERMQQIVSNKTIGIWDAQASSAAALSIQIQHLVDSLNMANKAAGGAPVGAQVLPGGVALDSKGKARYTADNPYGKKPGTFANLDEAHALEQAAAAAEKHEKSMRKLANGITAVTTAAGLLGTAFGPHEGVAYAITNALNIAGIFGMMFPGIITKVVTKVVAGANLMGNKLRGAFNMGSGGAGGFLKILKGAGPILAAVGVAGFAAFEYFQGQIDKAIDRVKEFNGYAKSMADILGYSYQEGGVLDPKSAPTGQRATEILAEQFKKSNSEAEAQFSSMQGRTIGEKWGVAVAAGIDAKLHGATVQQAKDTARVAMQLMGKTFDDAQFEVAVNARINFDDADSIMKAQIENWKLMFDRAAQDSGVNWTEQMFNAGQLSQTQGETIRKAGNDFWAMFFNADKAEREKTLRTVAEENDAFINDAYQKAIKAGVNMQNLGIKNATDFSKAISQGIVGKETLGMTDQQFTDLKRRNGAMIEFARATAMAAGVAEDAIPDIYRLFDLFRYDRITGFFQQTQTSIGSGIVPAFNNMFSAATGAGKGVADAAKSIEYFKNVAAGAKVEADQFNEQLGKMGYDSAITFDEISTSWKNIYSGAQDQMFQNAADELDRLQQEELDRVQKRGERALDAIDKRGDALDAKFEKKQQQMSDRQDREKKTFDRTWDARKDAAKKYYEARIEAIDKAIEAEQKAEETRQKIFEAEKTRIQRLAEMFSTSIDINMAVNSGQLDEAAKLSANAEAQKLQWAIDDQAGTSQTASQKRVDALESQKEAIDKAKEARLAALDAIEQREKDAMDARMERERRALKAQEDSAKKALEIEKKKQQDLNQQREKEVRDQQARTKRRLEAELSILRAFLPRNKAELDRQQGELNKMYDKYGGQLQAKGKNWAGNVGSALSRAVATEGNRLNTVVNWSKVGADIANGMIKGAFNMTPAQFAAFLNGGTAPKNSLFGTAPKSGVTPSTPIQNKYRGQLTDLMNRHTGGVISHGGGTGSRAGYSGDQKPGETMVNALVGEGIVSRKGMSMIGESGLDYINGGGKSKRGMGGGELGMGSLMGAVQAASAKIMIATTLAGVMRKRQTGDTRGYMAGKSGVKPDMASIFSNVLSAGTSPVYQSGKVIYLGHGAYPGGFNPGPVTRPTSGTVTSLFGPRNLLGMSFHNGIDIANAAGTPIKSAAAGRVIFTGWDNTGYGNYTQIQGNDGTLFGYGHQSAIGVRAGQKVSTGQLIGRMGSTGKSTGPHLHFQTGRKGIWFNPRSVMQLKNGGFTLNEGLANLHPKETVLTKPLTEDFKTGVQRFADGPENQYTVHMDFTGAYIGSKFDFQRTVEEALQNIDKRVGTNRKVTVSR